jgi:ABC-type iron transport system FetAB permease component
MVVLAVAGVTTDEMSAAMTGVMNGETIVMMSILAKDVEVAVLQTPEEGAVVVAGVATPHPGSTRHVKSAIRRAMLPRIAGGGSLMMIILMAIKR